MKKLFVTIILICTLCLSGCGTFEEMKEGMKKSRIMAENFCIELAYDNYDTARGYLHQQNLTKGDPRLFLSALNNMETSNGIDFSNGVKFDSCISMSSTYYDSVYDGSVYQFVYKMSVGSKTINMEFVVIDNDNGHGILSFEID